jgi:hypothetical protein
MRTRAFHILPWSLAAVYFAWSIFIFIFGGEWAPYYLYCPLWPFSIGLESLIKMLPEDPNAFVGVLIYAIWIVGGIVWCLFVGYLISWSFIRVVRLLCRGGSS